MSDNVMNIEDIKKAAAENEVIQKTITSAQNLEKKSVEQAKASHSIIEEIMNNIQEINPSLGGFEELTAILSLPDEQFSILAPIFIDELEKSFSNPNDRLYMLQAMQVSGMKAEDLADIARDMVKQLDEQLSDILTEPKMDFIKAVMMISINAMTESEGIPKRTIQIPIELCHPDAKMPTYANLGDAGLDIYALDDYTINPGETKLIPTGIKVAIPNGYELQVRPKSGKSLKTKLRVANTPGTIDSGYRDEIGVIIENVDPPIRDITYDFNDDGTIIIKSIVHGEPFYIDKGSKFAQLVLSEVPTAQFYEVKDINSIKGDRGGGFGSSGLK